MFRAAQIPARGKGSVTRQLSRMLPGSRVELFYGDVFVKFVTRWMKAGTCGDPVSTSALAKLNGDVMPVLLVPAWTPAGEVS